MQSRKDYVTRIHRSPLAIDAQQWDALLQSSPSPSPFMRHAYLAALHTSGSAADDTGWSPHFLALHHPHTDALLAACPLYLKTHSYGEYVFDWAWARAYEEHGLRYYPKAVVAVPFTPVSGSRLLCAEGFSRDPLMSELLSFCRQAQVSSLHLLFAAQEDVRAAQSQGLMTRDTVQFHWTNQGYQSFEHHLAHLSQDKRKKIRAEQRKVREAGVAWRWVAGSGITAADWDFFYACYSQTYREHGQHPYLSREFFARMAGDMPEHWLLFLAQRGGQAIACSLIGLERSASAVAYGRYWGALERVDCLHFDACYHQPLQWCIEHGIDRFEGGAQGEHKMARGLMPVVTHSAHWLAHPQFAQAVERFVDRERESLDAYRQHLARHTPFRPTLADPREDQTEQRRESDSKPDLHL